LPITIAGFKRAYFWGRERKGNKGRGKEAR